jgi:hypothetical protein
MFHMFGKKLQGGKRHDWMGAFLQNTTGEKRDYC